MLRLPHFGWVAAAAGACLLLGVWLDPGRSIRRQKERTEAQVRQAMQEERFLAQARAEPASGRLNLDFQRLNFYLPPDVHPTLRAGQGFDAYLPAGIRTYDGRDIRIQGYMLPTRLEQGAVKECLVLANQLGCCYGLEPRFCQFIAVRLSDPCPPELMDQPLRFEGKLHVGDVFAGGAWVALYSMDCTAVKP